MNGLADLQRCIQAAGDGAAANQIWLHPGEFQCQNMPLMPMGKLAELDTKHANCIAPAALLKDLQYLNAKFISAPRILLELPLGVGSLGNFPVGTPLLFLLFGSFPWLLV